VGAGQFKNYKPEGRAEAWRETHNVLLQVAAELGIFGLGIFGYLLAQGAMAGRQTRKLLKRARADAGRRGAAGGIVAPDEAAFFDVHVAAMAASLAGWFFCALFASVAYHWTFYYLLALAAAPREVLVDRLGLSSASRRPARRTLTVVEEARA
jgi:hypothetical protein